MTVVDNVEPIPFLITLSVIVAIWLAIGIRDRIITRRMIERFRDAVQRWDAVVNEGKCAHFWHAANDYHVCMMRYEHTGPHYDGITEVLEYR